MTNPIQKASIIDAKSQPVQNTPTPVVNTSPEYERQKLKELVSLQLKELLFKEVLKNNLENETKIKGKISINFLNNSQNPKSIPVRDITLQTLPYNIDKVINLILANKNYNAYILPFVSDNGGAEQCNVMGGESLIIDLDEGNTDEKLKLITQTFGTPSIILKSGSIVNGEYPCRHIYYKFDEYLSGDRFKKLLDIRGKIAKGFGGDVAYARNSAQLVRIFGSFNHKEGTKRVSKIEQNNLATAIYSFDDFCITADKYFGENPIVEKNIQQQLPLTASSANKEECVETLEFPIHQPPLELNDGQVIDYLNALVPDIFAKGNYELWLKALFATFHQYKGSEKGKQIFQEFSLKDNSRPENEILDSINQHWKYSKCEKTNQKVTTFRTIIDIVNNKDFVEKEIAKNPSFGSLVRVFDSTEMFGDTYVLTDKYLLVKITKGTGKNQITYLKHISDYINVLGTAPCDANMLHTLVKVKDRKGVDVVKIIPIGVKSAELRLFLINKLNFKFEDTNSSFSYLQKYLIARDEKNTKFRVAGRLGYCEDQNVFLVSYKKNRKDHIVAYQVDKNSNTNIDYFVKNSLKPEECLGIKGSLEDWQRHIANYALGNDLMTFSLCFPFASPFYTPLDIIPLIFNLAGESRKGKTILLNLASSVMGYSGNIGYSSWNSTKVGLENVAFVNNDRVAFVDDLHLADNSTLQAAGYIFVNSIGKSRGAKDQEQDFNIVTKRWRTSVLSTGENPFYAELEKRGLNARGGHANRIIDILAVVYQYGVFQNIHNFDKQFEEQDKSKEKGVKSFIEHLQQAALKYKGTAIAAFYDYIFNTRTFTDILVEIKNLKAEWEDKYLFSLKQLTQKNLGDIASRANNFSLIAASATIACDAGILPFTKEYIFNVVGKIFHNYLNSIKDVYLTADDRAIKDILVKFLNNNLQNGFYDKSNPNNNTPYTKYYGFKRAGDRVKETSAFIDYKYYLAVNQYDEIFKGFSRTIVKRFLQKQDYVLPNDSKKPSIDYTFDIKDKDNNKINCNLLNLVALGIILPDDDNFPDPTPPTDKLKDKPYDNPSNSSSNIEPIVVNTALESNVNSTFKPKWCIREKNELLDYLQTYYQEGRKITYFAFQTSDLREWDKLSLHELVKPLFAIGIKGELDIKPQLFRIRNAKLSQLEINTIIKCVFNDNFTLHFHEDLQQILEKLQGQQVHFSYAVDGEEKKPENLRVLFFKPKGGKTIGVRLEKGIISHAEQIMLNNIELIFSKASLDHRLYFPFINFEYTHAIDIALATRYTDTTIVNSLSEPCVKGINFNILGCETANIARSLIKNQDIFSRIGPEVLNEFQYRNAITNEYLEHERY